ncbi:hypothetical protein M3212_04805 [Alkalihalobacillus oceani]|uniref:hypothetical protein n=1 Tax=Halalkalibacter oceani TaxID=1653776 RepID=UPI00203CDAB0|nr:hypothetical protein [Halalkalibacter oceani]MCM3760108.1 hypothetical protein [Halalkalibacter oceani]
MVYEESGSGFLPDGARNGATAQGGFPLAETEAIALLAASTRRTPLLVDCKDLAAAARMAKDAR